MFNFKNKSKDKKKSSKKKLLSKKGQLPDKFDGKLLYRLFQEEEGAEKCENSPVKIKFLDESMTFCVSSQEIEVPELDKDAVKDIAILVGYLIESGFEKAYYQVDDTKIYVFDGYGSSYSFFQVELGDIEASEMAETFFEGEAHTKIDETLDKIKETYTKKSYTKEVLFSLIFFILIYFGYQFFSTSDIVQGLNKVPMPSAKKLTEKEILLLERKISFEVLEEIQKITEEYKKERFIFAKKRISVFTVAGFKKTPKINPSSPDEIHWGWPAGTSRRGSASTSILLTEEQAFPGVGYELAGGTIYQKSKSIKIEENGDYVDTNFMKLSSLHLSEKCLVSVLKLATDETKPKKRNDIYSEIELIRMKPAELVNKLSPIVAECPIIINRILLSTEGTFDVSVSVFKRKTDIIINQKRMKASK